MKVSALALAAVASVASASDFNLRSAAAKFVGASATADVVDARIAVHGLTGEVDDADMVIINQSIVAAYNAAYDAAGFSLTSIETKATATIPDAIQISPECRWCPPDDDMALKEGASEGQLVLARLQVGISPECRWCPPDDDARSFKSAADVADVHKTFETAFCAKLRASGSANMISAHTCSLSFLDMPGQPVDSVPIESGDSFNEAQITLEGTLHDLRDADFAIIDQSVIAAYNEAFSSAGFGLGSFESVADLEMPVGISPECRWCPPDDDMVTATSTATLVLARVAPLGISPECRWCPPDDDAVTTATVGAIEDSKLAFMHEAFEKAFCSKLGNSGSANLANVNKCSFRFVYSPAAGAVAAQE